MTGNCDVGAGILGSSLEVIIAEDGNGARSPFDNVAGPVAIVAFVPMPSAMVAAGASSVMFAGANTSAVEVSDLLDAFARPFELDP